MLLERWFARPSVGREEFASWARQTPGVDPVHHRAALRVCLPYLSRRPQKVLDIGSSPLSWLKTIARFAGTDHELHGATQGCRDSATGEIINIDGGNPHQVSLSPVELDIWSPLAGSTLPQGLPGFDFTLITALHIVDHLYHPAPFFQRVAEALRPGGLLVLTARNVGFRHNLLRLLGGSGIAGDLDALVMPKGGVRPLVRQYCWRELMLAAQPRRLVPVAHGFYDDPRRPKVDAKTGNALDEGVHAMGGEQGQLKSDQYLVLRKAEWRPELRRSAYLYRRNPRLVIQFLRDRYTPNAAKHHAQVRVSVPRHPAPISDSHDHRDNAPGEVSWNSFLSWARVENEYQKKIAGTHGADHPNPTLRGRSYFEVNLYRYFHALRVCWPYLNRPGQKIMDVGSWPGAWLRVISHFAGEHSPEVWASGLMFPHDFLVKMGGACKGILRCELDPHSPMRDRHAPTALAEKGFTFVSAMEVVEHLYHPAGMFRVIHEAMSLGGVLFLTTNNLTRLSNLAHLLAGDGLVENLDELLPAGGGKLGNWRPHAREYAWRDLTEIAQANGFRLITHGFYEENYGLKLIEGIDRPSEEPIWEDAEHRQLAGILRPLLAEKEQLQSGMYLLFERT